MELNDLSQLGYAMIWAALLGFIGVWAVGFHDLRVGVWHKYCGNPSYGRDSATWGGMAMILGFILFSLLVMCMPHR